MTNGRPHTYVESTPWCFAKHGVQLGLVASVGYVVTCRTEHVALALAFATSALIGLVAFAVADRWRFEDAGIDAPQLALHGFVGPDGVVRPVEPVPLQPRELAPIVHDMALVVGGPVDVT